MTGDDRGDERKDGGGDDSSVEREDDGGPVLVDARGLRCPLPVIRLAAALRDEGPSAMVRLLASDPAARSDVAAFCRMRGHDLVEVTDREPPGEPVFTAYLVRRGGQRRPVSA